MKKELLVAINSVIKVKNWYTFYRIHQGKLKGGEYIIKLRNDVKFIIRGVNLDAGALREIAVQNHYKLEQIKKDDIIVDIGAHIGIFSILAAKKGKLVISYEPAPENFSLLKKNIGLNKIENIRPFNKAVGGKNKKRKIFLTPLNPGGHGFFEKSEKSIEISKTCTPQGYITADTITLEQIFKDNKIEKIDCLKVDCEGAEYEILFSAKKETLKKINRIVMEYHNIENHNADEIIAFLKQNSFKVEKKALSEGLGLLYANS